MIFGRTGDHPKTGACLPAVTSERIEQPGSFDARTSTCRFAQWLSLFMRLSLFDIYKLVFLKGIKDILVATRIGKRDVIHGYVAFS